MVIATWQQGGQSNSFEIIRGKRLQWLITAKSKRSMSSNSTSSPFSMDLRIWAWSVTVQNSFHLLLFMDSINLYAIKSSHDENAVLIYKSSYLHFVGPNSIAWFSIYLRKGPHNRIWWTNPFPTVLPFPYPPSSQKYVIQAPLNSGMNKQVNGPKFWLNENSLMHKSTGRVGQNIIKTKTKKTGPDSAKFLLESLRI